LFCEDTKHGKVKTQNTEKIALLTPKTLTPHP
jgi:hypothetical protein